MVMAIHRAFSYAREPLWQLCMGDLRVCRESRSVLHTYAQLPPLSKCKRNGVGSLITGYTPLIKPTPNPPEHEDTSPYESLDSKKLHEAAERALNHHFAPPPSEKPKPRKGNLFSVSPDIDTEALLANASEDLLSISAISANLADDVEGPLRSVALAISRMSDGVRLLVERALDHIDTPNPAVHRAKG
jgi:hypothetical protein